MNQDNKGTRYGKSILSTSVPIAFHEHLEHMASREPHNPLNPDGSKGITLSKLVRRLLREALEYRRDHSGLPYYVHPEAQYGKE